MSKLGKAIEAGLVNARARMGEALSEAIQHFFRAEPHATYVRIDVVYEGEAKHLGLHVEFDNDVVYDEECYSSPVADEDDSRHDARLRQLNTNALVDLEDAMLDHADAWFFAYPEETEVSYAPDI